MYTDWDHALLRAVGYIEDYTDPNTGFIVWIDQSPKVHWKAEVSYSGSQQAIEEYQDSHKHEPGQIVRAIPEWDEEDPPTLEEWINNVKAGNTRSKPKVEGVGMAPTKDQLEQLRKLREKQSQVE